jgi:hypothetical protein
MIKRLFFMAALLMPSLAHGANPTADLSVQIVPADATPAVPAAAQAAGFTTLAKNWDFSQPLYARESNWLDCGLSTNTNKDWHQNASIANGPPVFQVPICSVPQVVDQGFTVIDLPWTTNQTDYPTNVIQSIRTVSADGTTALVNFGAFYAEAEYRMTPVQNNSFTAFWSSATPPTSNTRDLEYDIIEMGLNDSYAGGAGQNLHNWQGGTGGCPPYNFNCGTDYYLSWPSQIDISAYHKFGMLVTNDGTTAWTCGYYDGAPIGNCFDMNAQVNSGGADDQTNNRQYMMLWSIGQDLGHSVRATQDAHMYIKYVRVWSCANWQTQLCHGSMFTTHP